MNIAGAPALARLALRRDRIRILIWGLVTAGMVASVASIWDELYPTAQSRLELAAALAVDPALSAVLGPLFDPLSTGALTAWRVMSWLTVVLGLAAGFLVTRNTRAQEAAGVSELVGSTAVGRSAPVVAGLASGWGLSLLFTLLAAASMIATGLAVNGSVLFALAAGMVAFVVVGVAAVNAQLFHTSRATNSATGIVVAVLFLLPGIGNVSHGLHWLVWASPIGWAQQARAFAGDRWSILLLGLVTGLLLATVAGWLANRRDLGSGLSAGRAGSATAAAWIKNPFSLALRLDRGWLIGWVLSAALLGVVTGFLIQTSVGLVTGNPQLEKFLAALGGSTKIAEAFGLTELGIIGMIAGGFAISTILRLAADEEEGRAAHLLSAPVSRRQWLGGHASIAVLGSIAICTVGGFMLGLTYASAGHLGVAQQALRWAASGLILSTAAVLFAAVALLAVAVLGRLAGVITWTLFSVIVGVGFVGQILNLPRWMLDLSPYNHLPGYPATSPPWMSIAVFIALSVLAAVIADQAIQRRDSMA